MQTVVLSEKWQVCHRGAAMGHVWLHSTVITNNLSSKDLGGLRYLRQQIEFWYALYICCPVHNAPPFQFWKFIEHYYLYIYYLRWASDYIFYLHFQIN